MKLLLHFCILYALTYSANAVAKPCNNEVCKRENDCACASTWSPIKNTSTPQFVTFTIDDGVTALNYDQYYSKAFFNRKNPDGKPISATFFVPHQSTDYEKVNMLYNKGFVIGSHSVSKYPVEYWQDATVEILTQEFGDSRKIISKYANISIEDIVGARTPHLELAGDNSFQAYTQAGIKYDNSFVSLSGVHLFPFTLDYAIGYDCVVGTCPVESYPHFWVLPIINLKGKYGYECNALFGCQITGSAEEISNWLIQQFHAIYDTSKAPISYLINAVWFQAVENSYEAFEMFLNYLGTKKDVFLVSHDEVIAWSRNPVPIEEYESNHRTKSQSCSAISCTLQFEVEGILEERRMRSCVACPSEYPWLGNPDGN
ncbi:hypothetical protein FQA39_LY08186 [Lamprigera yunnana]|nr:hypothetical protein FQA39_LY08186 [Lamprigera yunnana]